MKAQTETSENPGEMYFRWYIEELQAAGYIKNFYREPETVSVLKAGTHKRLKRFKSKANIDEVFNLLPEITYTYDFKIIWDESALKIFTEVYNKQHAFEYNIPPFISHYINEPSGLEIVSFVDVKPHASAAKFGGGKLSTFYTFPYVQKFLFATRGLYINKIVPTNAGKHGISTCLFATTFVPNRFRFTDGGQQERNIKMRKTPLASFVKNKLAIIADLDSIEDQKKMKNSQQTLL